MKRASYASWFAITLLLWASSVLAEPSLEVRDAWIQATVPGQAVAGAYMTLRSPVASRLVAVSSNVSNSADVHSMAMDNGVMRMRHVESLDLPADKAVTLAPGGLHLMLAGLARQLKPGDMVEFRFTTVDGAGRKSTTEVQAPGRKEAPR